MTSTGWGGSNPSQVGDPDTYEIGTEFLANVDITISHVRVFSGATPVATTNRTGKIWSTTGTVLGTATMPDSLTPGWTLHALAAPVDIASGGRFVVSYSTAGNYAATPGALASSVVSPAPGDLTALASGSATNGNGIFNETPTSFPTGTFNSTFYGVDVGYDLQAGDTAPVISGVGLTTPGDGVTVDAMITASDAETLVGAIYRFDWGDGSTVTSGSSASAQHTYAASGLKAVLASVTDAGGNSDYFAAAINLLEPAPTGVDVPAIVDGLISHAQSLGLFSTVNGHEPKAAPSNGVHGALWVDEIAPAQRRSGLPTTSVRLAFNFRVGLNMITEPQDDIDPRVLVAVMALMRAYSGDFSLGGEVAFIDLLGAHGAPLAARAGYLNQDGKMFRVMVIQIPLILNDVFDQSP